MLRLLPGLYDGSHIKHPLASRRSVRRVDFKSGQPVDVAIDGEVFTLELKALDILPSALDVYI